MELTDDVVAGQRVYNRFTLSLYDLILFKICTGPIWGCSTDKLLQQYNDNISNNHLDVGVGSGYLLDKCQFPTAQPQLALMDLNEASLSYTANRLRRYNPTTYRRNILAPIALDGAKYDSIGLNYLLHCLPGNIVEKSVVFDHLYQHLQPGGVIFGTTILGSGIKANYVAKRLMKIYNKKQVFCNAADDLASFKQSLASRYADFSLNVQGCAVMFVIHKPRDEN